ncbi:uncharacterized protein LOC117119160 [Anneissia japonica]|uniref:uncharacterized protein LOC117119160 n=1 Tax=Anneissia japonica TaxID=1529436 RepID=UPI0014255DA5|nr:uncharacterized protein LOC117119160 [Anneissia japonica]XP_033119862.1 uncharacterized protein LOC117119160 [Anneissia japonica]
MESPPGTSNDIEKMEKNIDEKKDGFKKRQKVNVFLCAIGVMLVIVIIVSLIMMGPLRPPPYDKDDSAIANRKITIKLEDSRDEVDGKGQIDHQNTTPSTFFFFSFHFFRHERQGYAK